MQKSAKSMLLEITVFRSLIKRLYYCFAKNHLVIPNPESKMIRRIKLEDNDSTVPIKKKPHNIYKPTLRHNSCIHTTTTNEGSLLLFE